MTGKMKKIIICVAVSLFAIVLVGSIVGSASAGMGGGAVGYYGGNAPGVKTGCIDCHGTTAGLAGQVVINGPTAMKAGETATFTIALIGAPPGPAGGIDAAIEQYNPETGESVKADGLATGINTQYKAESKEITHASALAFTPVNGRVWTFDWTAPAEGSYTLYAVTVAANGNGRPDYDTLPKGVADGWYLGNQAITVSK